MNVSCIQHFSTGDGPGIRTTVFLKGCNLHCPWCHNPENISSSPVTLKYEGSDKVFSYGKSTEISEIAAEVIEDKDYYGLNDVNVPAEKRGGLTLSGGEPMLQSTGAAELVKLLEKSGIPSIIDTAGNVPWTAFVPLLGHVQAFYFDYKSGSDAIYRDVIGGDRELVIDNLKQLIDAGETVHVRIPLIPGVNTRPEDAEEMCRQLSEIGVKCVDLLPFHRLGSGKYAAMGLNYKYKNEPPLDRNLVRELKLKFDDYFDCHVE